MLTNNKLFTISIIAIFLFSMSNIKVEGYATEITVSYANVIVDISRGAFHTEFNNFEGNMSLAGNTVEINLDPITDLNDTSGFFISQPDSGYTLAEKEVILNFLKLGNRTLFVTSDSDHGGYFTTLYANDLLNSLNSSLRLGSDSIADSVYNDGASYRTIATEYGNGTIANITKQDCLAGIVLHGPSSVLGYNGTDIIDLRTEKLPNVEVLVHHSEHAISFDSDVSETIYDYYTISPIQGLFPVVASEKIVFDDVASYIIVAGEVIFADYKYMYDQYTETGVYNGGIHYGQMFVDNLVSFFLANATFEPVVNEFQQGFTIVLFSSIMIFIVMTNIRRKRK